MNLDSVRSLKAEISAEVVASHGSTPEALSFFEATEPPMPPGVALGVAHKDGEYVLAVRTADPALAAVYAERARGEADVRILTVTKRTTPGYLQGTRRPLEPGLQVGMADRNFIGTLGCFVQDAEGRVYALSNAHVVADEGLGVPGHAIGQPYGAATSRIGVLARFVPMSLTAPNLVDAGLVRLDMTSFVRGFNGALGGQMYGTRALRPEDLGAEVVKNGRTTGSRLARVTAVEVDGLPVGYDRGVIRFNDQHEFSGGPSTDFSAGGDSGSLIVHKADRMGVALLFAGGRDDKGEDFTYGNPIQAVMSALGVTIAL